MRRLLLVLVVALTAGCTPHGESARAPVPTVARPTPPALPTCSRVLPATPARYSPPAHLDVIGATAAQVCRYFSAAGSRQVSAPLAYRVPAPSLPALIAAVGGERPIEPALVDCAGPSSTTYQVSLILPGRLVQLTGTGPGCGYLVSDGLAFSSRSTFLELKRSVPLLYETG